MGMSYRPAKLLTPIPTAKRREFKRIQRSHMSKSNTYGHYSWQGSRRTRFGSRGHRQGHRLRGHRQLQNTQPATATPPKTDTAQNRQDAVLKMRCSLAALSLVRSSSATQVRSSSEIIQSSFATVTPKTHHCGTTQNPTTAVPPKTRRGGTTYYSHNTYYGK